MESFKEYNISKEILDALDLLSYDKPTLVQEKAINAILEGNNVLIKSKTGSGKTAAFAIPLIEKVIWENRNPQVLVLTPTRELAMQIKEEIFNIGRFKRIKAIAVYGKTSFLAQEKQLKQRQHIVIATPGRMLDHIKNETINLSEIKSFVIDEVDEMMKMGFVEDVLEIFNYLNVDQTIFLSATMNEKVLSISKNFMDQNVYIKEEESKISSELMQKYIVVNKEKEEKIFKFIEDEEIKTAIIFCNTQIEVEKVYDFLISKKLFIKKLHGGLDQKIRTKAINDFKEGKIRYLVATDVLARGIDVNKVEYVINYDIPKDFNTFIHRIGRTNRMNDKGNTISFINSSKVTDFQNEMKKLGYKTSEYIEKKNKSDSSVNSIYERPVLKPKKDENLTKDILKIHINAGKKTKMRASDIVGTICSIEGIEAADIGVITILDISTFVEIMNSKGEYVYEVLQSKPIKGRLRIVSKSL